MDREDVVRQRLATQRLTSAGFDTAAEVVRLLTCVQCQERDHAYFSLGLRGHGLDHESVATELDTGAFVRTHILRPTWHFVLAEDLRWILALTSPRVEQKMAARHRQLGLHEPGLLDRSLDAVTSLLAGRRFMTRRAIGDRLAGRSDVAQAGPQLGHALMVGELRGLICSGASEGPHHTYALVDEVVAPTPGVDRDEALVRLVHRFFAGHGPADAKDFARWSSLTVGDTKAALARLGGVLERMEVDGMELWFDPAATVAATAEPPAILFPTYDEAVLSYPRLNFEIVEDHPHHRDADPDPFWAYVVMGTRNVGMWKRSVRTGTVDVRVRLAPSLDSSDRQGAMLAARRLADFLGRELAYVEEAPS